MARTRTFRVVNGRIQFKCAACQAKRMISIPPGLRKRSFRCHKCKELTRCTFNRRIQNRDQQRGKLLLTNTLGNQFEVDLFDISLHGVGFNVKFNDLKNVSVGQSVNLRCPWNPRLVSNGRYLVKSIKGQRIGAETERKGFI
jgi:hypothetical protein